MHLFGILFSQYCQCLMNKWLIVPNKVCALPFPVAKSIHGSFVIRVETVVCPGPNIQALQPSLPLEVQINYLRFSHVS
jgi:hypothetical protein